MIVAKCLKYWVALLSSEMMLEMTEEVSGVRWIGLASLGLMFLWVLPGVRMMCASVVE